MAAARAPVVSPSSTKDLTFSDPRSRDRLAVASESGGIAASHGVVAEEWLCLW